MVLLYLSYTSKINKEGDAPVLTIDQVWKGLQRKVRFAQEFVPIIESCTVIEEKEDGTVVRDVKFKEGAGPKPQARETVKEYYPSWVSITVSFFNALMFSLYWKTKSFPWFRYGWHCGHLDGMLLGVGVRD